MQSTRPHTYSSTDFQKELLAVANKRHGFTLPPSSPTVQTNGTHHSPISTELAMKGKNCLLHAPIGADHKTLKPQVIKMRQLTAWF